MASPSSLHLHIPIFTGQDTVATRASRIPDWGLRDAAPSSGSLLLSSRHAVFRIELPARSSNKRARINLVITDSEGENDLLTCSKASCFLPAVSGPTPFLLQSLCYLTSVGTLAGSTHPFRDVFQRDLERGLGVSSFSSEVLVICVVGASSSTFLCIRHAVETGIRTQIHRQMVPDVFPLDANPPLPWRMALSGMEKDVAGAALITFNKDLKATSSFYLTAIMDGTCVIVSGRPDVLVGFSKSLEASIVAYKATLNTFLIHSTSTGDLVTKDPWPGSLLELAVDMPLAESVSWDLTCLLPENYPVRLLNVGPGPEKALVWGLGGAFPRKGVSSVDMTSSRARYPGQVKEKQGSIAIVGHFEVSEHSEGIYHGRSMNDHTNGNFIDGMKEIDNKSFKTSSLEVKGMDSQWCILLQVGSLEKSSTVWATTEQAPIVFVFSGRGFNHLGMGSILYRTSPLFTYHIDGCHSTSAAYGSPGVLSIISGAGFRGFALQEIEGYQTALSSLPYALARLWISLGALSGAVVEHSLMGTLPPVESWVHFKVQKMERGITAPNHSSEASYGDLSRHVALRASTILVVPNALAGAIWPGDVFNTDYFSQPRPIKFDEGIHVSVADPASAGVGPRRAILPALRSSSVIPREGSLVLGSLCKQWGAWSILAKGLEQLYMSGADVRWRSVFAHPARASPLSYPLLEAGSWAPHKEDRPMDVETVPALTATILSPYSMLHAWVQHPTSANGFVAKFETPISHIAGSICGHSVGGVPLCPASVYLEQAFAGINLVAHHLGERMDDNHVALRRVRFVKPLVYDKRVDRCVTTSITMSGDCGTFSISSRVALSSQETIHVHGDYRLCSIKQTKAKFSRVLPIIRRRMIAVAESRDGLAPEVFSTRAVYEIIFPRVIEYATEYHTIRSLTVEAGGMRACATIKLPNDHHQGRFAVHPILMDTLLHVAGFVVNLQGSVDDAYICTEVGSVKVIPGLVDNGGSYLVYCTNTWLPEEGVMLAESHAVDISAPWRIIAQAKNMQFRRARLSSLKKGLTRAAGQPTLPRRPMARPVSPQSFDRSHHHPDPVSDVQTKLLKIISDACGIDIIDLDLDIDLASLGIDSPTTVNILNKLETIFPDATLDARAISFCHSVQDMLQMIHAQVMSIQTRASSPTTQIPSGASSPQTLVLDDALLEPDVKQVLTSILGIDAREIEDDADFISLGLDSLTSMEALKALGTEFGYDLSSDFFTTCRNVRSAQAYLSACRRENAKFHEPTAKLIEPKILTKAIEAAQINANRIVKALRLDTIPTPIQQTSLGGRTPLFLIHDGSGLVNYYDRLTPLNRPIWGIHNPHFASSQPWDRMELMATAYANHILNVTSGPVILGGWSFGGVAAYEIALQLKKRGVRVQGILLIDSPSPINHVPLSDSLIESVVKLGARSTNSELARLVKNQFAMNARMLGRYNPPPTKGASPPIVLLRSTEGYESSGVPDVPVWLADRRDPTLSTAGWEKLTGSPIKTLDIPGDHFQPFQPLNIGRVSLRMAEGCDHFEQL